jgi:hypothetical protein
VQCQVFFFFKLLLHIISAELLGDLQCNICCVAACHRYRALRWSTALCSSRCHPPSLRSSRLLHNIMVVASHLPLMWSSWALCSAFCHIASAIIAEFMGILQRRLSCPYCRLPSTDFNVRPTNFRSTFVQLLFDLCLTFVRPLSNLRSTSIRLPSGSVHSAPFRPLTSVHGRPSTDNRSSSFIPGNAPYSSNRMLC